MTSLPSNFVGNNCDKPTGQKREVSYIYSSFLVFFSSVSVVSDPISTMRFRCRKKKKISCVPVPPAGCTGFFSFSYVLVVVLYVQKSVACRFVLFTTDAVSALVLYIKDKYIPAFGSIW